MQDKIQFLWLEGNLNIQQDKKSYSGLKNGGIVKNQIFSKMNYILRN